MEGVEFSPGLRGSARAPPPLLNLLAGSIDGSLLGVPGLYISVMQGLGGWGVLKGPPVE